MKYLNQNIKKIKLNNKFINFIDVPIKNINNTKKYLKIVFEFL